MPLIGHKLRLSLVLGVDAGGTKTIAVVADQAGNLHGLGRAGSANYQACGVAGAREQIQRAIEEAAEQAGIGPAAFAAACFGVAGADRPKDFAIIRKFVEPLAPCPVFRLENDTIIALRAGTSDGVGIALIAGTGSNSIGRTRQGVRLQVGGLGPLSGDFGSASQLAEAAVVAAMMDQDGRGPPTTLKSKIKKRLGLENVEDIIEFGFHDSDLPHPDLGSLAPLVFEAASEGDAVAQQILQAAGKQIARAVGVILDRLFPGQDEVTVVFGGSIFQKGTSPALIQAVVQETRSYRPNTRFVRLEVQPVLGAVNFAFDDLGWPVTEEVWKQMRRSFDALDGGQTS